MLKLHSLFVLIALIGIVAGCGGKAEQPTAPPPAGSEPEAGAAEPAPAEEAARPEIAVIPKGSTHAFWKTIHAGAAKAAKEADVDIIWMSGEKEDDRKQQIDLVESFIARGVDAIVLAPLDNQALVRPVETAVQRGIPVVIIDSGLESEAQSSFVATDNREGGRMGARRLGEVMGGKGKAILLRYSEGSASTHNREEGFLEEMQASFPDIELVSTNQYAGATKESAFQASQNLLNKFRDQVQGVFCPNESSSFGMLQALRGAGLAGQIQFVGFDTSEGLVEGLRQGDIQGLVAQDPFDMGYQGVKTAVAVLQGKEVEARVPTGLAVITPENIDTPEMKVLIEPELEKWLE